jgi:signal peptidase
MRSNNKDKNNVYKYLLYFVSKAFLISIICFIVFIGLIISIYFIDTLYNVKTGNYKNPLFNAYIIVSPSMVPTIKINDAIIIKRIDNDNYNIGDVISFNSSDKNYLGLTITHRIVSKITGVDGNSTYTTKGDNNNVNDPTSVSTSDIYGKVIFKIPKLGYIQNFLNKPSNFFLCILIPAGLVIVYDVFRIVSVMNYRKKYI